ncbi:MAG: membrane integrity-associated transporter subunit PqiC [Porticoccus sp.]|nr:membrane integrity-associated transporter subunit PqiC [Porticoccus sp.]
MKYLALVALFLVGCSSSPVPSLNQYLLRTDTPVQFSQQDSVVVGIGTVTVAPYIDGLGLVLETGNGEVHIARDHQWVEPLRVSLRSFLSGKISKELGQPIRAYSYGKIEVSRRIDIRIDELHGTINGDAKLVAYWVIIDSDKQVVLSENSFIDTEALTRGGYDALVEAQKKLLDRLASGIAATLSGA